MSPGEELWGHFNAINDQQQVFYDDEECHLQIKKNQDISPEQWAVYLRKAGGDHAMGKVKFDFIFHLIPEFDFSRGDPKVGDSFV